MGYNYLIKDYCLGVICLITEPTPPPPTPPGTIVGITVGATVFVVIVCLFILHKNGKLKEMKQRWDRFVANTRRRISSWNPRNRVRHRPRPNPTYVSCRHNNIIISS